MRLLEYQAKELFKEYDIRVPDSIASKDIESGRKDAKKIGYPFVIKAQVPVGGRGKAGGIQKCHNEDEFELRQGFITVTIHNKSKFIETNNNILKLKSIFRKNFE